MKRFCSLCLTAAALLLIVSIRTGSAAPDDSTGLAAMKTGMDSSSKPGDDFYQYANGGWLKATPLPPEQGAYGTTNMLRELNKRRVEEMLAELARPVKTRARLEQQVGDTCASLTDTTTIDARGLAALAGDLAIVDGIHDRASLATFLGHVTRLGDGAGAPAESIFGVWIHQGFSEAERYLPHMQQGGLGLSNRDDYLDQAPAKLELRAKYRTLIAAVLKQLAAPDADADAARVLTLETAIARSHATQADTDDVFKDNNVWTLADFDAKAAGMDWPAYFRAAGLAGQDEFVVWQPAAVIGVSTLAASEKLSVWKAYLKFHLIKHYAPELPAAYRNLFLTFDGEPIGDGAPTAARALLITQNLLGEAIGNMYVARYFPPEAKAAANAMVENIKLSLRAHIANLTWMTPETKTRALAKLNALNVGLGYPDRWTDFGELRIVRDDALGNARRIEEFNYRQQIAKLRQPVDVGEWSIAPQSVSALINFFPNALQFSAGLLQPPYFDYQGDSASNYGSAGAGISHEILHSFDELGNIYGAQGRLQLWWTTRDTEHFKASIAPLAAQFNAYCPVQNLCVRGQQVLGENIDDLGGLIVAYDAYHLSLKGTPDVIKAGLTGDQRFFLAFAQRWRKLQTEADLRHQILNDTHSPGPYRSDTVRNLDAWYDAFHVIPGDRLYLKPEARVHVW